MHYILIALIVMDALSTVVGLRSGCDEENLLLAGLMKIIGPYPALAVTHIGSAALVYLYPPSGPWLWICIVFMCGIVALNLHRLGKI